MNDRNSRDIVFHINIIVSFFFLHIPCRNWFLIGVIPLNDVQ